MFKKKIQRVQTTISLIGFKIIIMNRSSFISCSLAFGEHTGNPLVLLVSSLVCLCSMFTYSPMELGTETSVTVVRAVVCLFGWAGLVCF